MSKSTFKGPSRQRRRGQSAFVRWTSLALALMLITGIVGTLVGPF